MKNVCVFDSEDCLALGIIMGTFMMYDSFLVSYLMIALYIIFISYSGLDFKIMLKNGLTKLI